MAKFKGEISECVKDLKEYIDHELGSHDFYHVRLNGRISMLEDRVKELEKINFPKHDWCDDIYGPNHIPEIILINGHRYKRV